MDKGYLSKHFSGVAAKTLRDVEIDSARSHQHEFNGVAPLRGIFGAGRVQRPAQFIYLSDDAEPVAAEGSVTWYDARAAHKHRTEYRLYFKTNDAMSHAHAGDTLFVAATADDKLLVLIVGAGSTTEQQLCWLFDQRPADRFDLHVDFPHLDSALKHIAQNILSEIGIEPEPEKSLETFVPEMAQRFHGAWPSVKAFGSFARSVVTLDPQTVSPDQLIVHWMACEQDLYRLYENYLLKKARAKYDPDREDVLLDEVYKPALNRRKVRAGLTLEDHLAEIFKARGLRFSTQGKTERNRRPDFVFPSIQAYHDPTFNPDLLTMLGAKRTCKDRWRQVLAEADRIPNKHLFTLEPGISENQTNEMQATGLQLVVPEPIRPTYSPAQQQWLMSLSEFIDLVTIRQSAVL